MSIDILLWKFSRANIPSCDSKIITLLVSTAMFSGLMVRIEKHTGTLLWWIWIQFKDGHRGNVFCYCIEDIHMVRKHSFVYLNIYNVTPLQTCHKIWVVIPNVHNLMCTIMCAMSYNWHIESYSSWLPLHLRIRVTGKMKQLIYIMEF